MTPRPPIADPLSPDALRARLRALADVVREDVLPVLVAAAEAATASPTKPAPADVAPAAIMTDEEFVEELKRSEAEVERGETVSWEDLRARLFAE